MHKYIPKLVVVLLTGLFLWAGDKPSFAPSQDKPGEALAPAVRQALDGESFVVEAGNTKLHFWMRRSIPLKTDAAQLGISFGRIEVGTLLGAVQIDGGWEDYKGKPVPAGVYTLRYAQQPADGNHTGVTSYRDFSLLLPASEDQDPAATPPQPELVFLSRQASGTTHPATMALFPIYDEVKHTSMVQNELEQWTVAWKLADLTVGFVVVGHGTVEGY